MSLHQPAFIRLIFWGRSTLNKKLVGATTSYVRWYSSSSSVALPKYCWISSIDISFFRHIELHPEFFNGEWVLIRQHPEDQPGYAFRLEVPLQGPENSKIHGSSSNATRISIPWSSEISPLIIDPNNPNRRIWHCPVRWGFKVARRLITRFGWIILRSYGEWEIISYSWSAQNNLVIGFFSAYFIPLCKLQAHRGLFRNLHHLLLLIDHIRPWETYECICE